MHQLSNSNFFKMSKLKCYFCGKEEKPGEPFLDHFGTLVCDECVKKHPPFDWSKV